MRRTAARAPLRAAAMVALLVAPALGFAQQRNQAPAPRPSATAARGDTVPGDTARNGTRPREDTGAAADTVFQALRRLPGFTVMEYRGDSATFRADQRVLRLFGPAEVQREGERLSAADTIVYRESSRLIEAFGRPRLSGQAEEIEGEIMLYDLATRRAIVRGGRTRVAEAGATWFVRGDVTAEGTDRLYANRSRFTTDDREDPGYFFEADDIKVIRDRILVGRPARLYFRNVPVFWLPFVVQDLTRGRRSGLLAPEFSINDIVRNQSAPAGARGTGRQISNLGFYWVMNDYMDAQVSGAWRSGDYTAVRGALRYRWTEQFLDGSFSYSQFWRDNGQRQLQLFANNSWRPDERTSLSLNANFASTQFLREITTDYFRSTQDIASDFKLNRRFDWGNLDVGANRRQSLANDRITMELPSLGIALQPITFFQPATPDQQRWYSNATLNPGTITAGRSMTRFGEPLQRTPLTTQRDQDLTRFQVGPSFTVGNLSLSSGFNLNRTQQPLIAPVDTFPALPRLDRDEGSWRTSLSYRVGLVGETFLSPTVSLSQDLRSGTFALDPFTPAPFLPQPVSTDGRYVTSPLRTSVGASLNTALFGFLPGFGPFTTIRHKLSPGFSYSYVPEVPLTPEQERIFGPQGGFAQNNLSLLSLSQTFEAKMRGEGRPPATRPAGADTLGADTVAAGTAAPAPAEERKVTLLSLTTSGFNYDFERAARGLPGLTTRQVSNTIASDYLRGLQVNVTHDLFDAGDLPLESRQTESGRFSPRLSSLSTQFSLGQDSPFLRWLGLGGRVQGAPEMQQDSIPTEPRPAQPLDPLRRQPTFTNNPQTAGRGPWRLDVGYALYRPRDGGLAAQDLQLGMSFAPTPNWAVNWATNYSIEDGAFGGHRVTLRRDLYRWEANFNFDRTPFGNTSFGVLIRLKDLPDLKVDYREDNIGANRPGGF